jgi:hypothetical protein
MTTIEQPTPVNIKYTIEPLHGGGAYVKIPVEASHYVAWIFFICCAILAGLLYFLSTLLIYSKAVLVSMVPSAMFILYLMNEII